ncbi:hypothetical protein CPB83DRAFT_845563 [Crepidotus variabilis]|uniref:F-box domain-containing protein n=1 Tax=Crepidotus variabilis TaxID=179855 RepID=A0A9P6JUN5_9AGAR|nr:hypothetical protein CPB83DRAFT_845563 [Crepidotus variabilis]
MTKTQRGLISHKGQTRYVAKQPSGKAARRQRTTMSLVDLPMDIILEVLGHVEPLDLLNLLATSKTFKNLLMKRSSRLVWRRARANVPDFPECPDDLTEIGYARLVFESHCQVCDQGRSYDVRLVRMWSARARFCGECLEANFVQKETGKKLKNIYPEKVKKVLPTRVPWHGHESIYKPLDELWAKEYKRLKTDADRDHWVKKKVKERKDIEEHSTKLNRWFRLEWEPELVLRKTLRFQQRQAQIMTRLRKSGWEEELRVNRSCDNLLDDRRVRKACERELTEKVLDELVEYLEIFLEKVKEQRLKSIPQQIDGSPPTRRTSTRTRVVQRNVVDLDSE